MSRRPSLSAGRDALGLAGWLLLVFCAAAAGGMASARSADFYRDLVQPAWAPPAWLFGPVWTLLYTLMGVAAWRVWRARGFAGAGHALGLFVAQLLFNALWTWLFFVWRLGAWALVDIVLLWGLITATALAFWPVSRLSTALLLPYLAWVGFAGALNFSLWRLNPALLG